MKALKWILIIVAVLGIVGYFGMDYMKKQTKKASPEQLIVYDQNGTKLEVFYCSPFKKDRTIFGELVPYNEVWRTGANEPTTFSTSSQIKFGDQELAPGTYTMWTIPQPTQWTIIMNSKMYDWGVGFGGVSREPEFDVLKINVPVQDLNEPVEQLTMEFIYHVNLSIAWDKTKVMVPIQY
jgi:hypothetical protein